MARRKSVRVALAVLLLPARVHASPLRWDGVPLPRVRTGVAVTAATSTAVAVLLAGYVLRRPTGSTAWRALQWALVGVLALIGASGFWLLLAS